MTPPDRPTGTTDDGVAHQRSEAAAQVDSLVAAALTGLSAMYRPDTHELVQTVRGAAGPFGPRLVPEGSNLRYAAIVALGLHLTDQADQRRVLQGETASGLTAYLVAQAGGHREARVAVTSVGPEGRPIVGSGVRTAYLADWPANASTAAANHCV